MSVSRSDGSGLAGAAVEQLADDVEVADVPGVLLDQVQEHALQGGGWVAGPPLPRLADLVEAVPAGDPRRGSATLAQRGTKVRGLLLGADVPAAVPGFAPRVPDVAALEPPLQPAQLDVRQVLDQGQR